MHLVMDGYGADPRRLQDEALVHQFLNDYPAAIAMTKIAEPFVYRYTTGATPEDWGVSGFVLIAESHISIHTFPERGYINVDIFSCKPFDADAAQRELTGRFGLQSVKSWVLDRGLEQFAARPAPVTGASYQP